jgi:hypothetical protein
MVTAMRSLAALPLSLVIVLAGCAGRASEPPVATVPFLAWPHVVGDHLRIDVDTHGARVEHARMLLEGGQSVPPETIEHPAPAAPSGAAPVSGMGIGFGVGGGRWGGGGGGVVGMGTGVGFSFGGDVGGSHPDAPPTVLHFPLSRIGPPPWRLEVQAAGAPPAVVTLDAPPPR